MTINTVLLIDDDDDIRAIAAVSLGSRGPWIVLQARSGREGVALAASSAPDLILLDVTMPTMDGPTTLLRLREQPATRDTPVIFMTARGKGHDDELVAHLISLGAAGVITKPFHPMNLADDIRKIIG